MKALMNRLKSLVVRYEFADNKNHFLDNIIAHPEYNKVVEAFNDLTPEHLGVKESTYGYHFKETHNISIIEETPQFKAFLYCIKKGSLMPLHDHPNSMVFFNVLFGKLIYLSMDKLDDKYKYNDFSEEEYLDFIINKK